MRTDILSAYVTIADLNEKRGAELVKELSLLVNHSPPLLLRILNLTNLIATHNS